MELQSTGNAREDRQENREFRREERRRARQGERPDRGRDMYRAVTRDIEVVVTPRFVADRSSPENNYFFWAYTISITNNGSETVQLKTRHWRITDAHGRK